MGVSLHVGNLRAQYRDVVSTIEEDPGGHKPRDSTSDDEDMRGLFCRFPQGLSQRRQVSPQSKRHLEYFFISFDGYFFYKFRRGEVMTASYGKIVNGVWVGSSQYSSGRPFIYVCVVKCLYHPPAL